MLRMAESMGQLDFSRLMAVYRASNLEKARRLFPGEPEDVGLRMAETEFYEYLSRVFFQTPGAVYALWEAEGRPVSALRLEPYQDGWLLAGVETAPDCRRMGYAAALVEAACQSLVSGKVYAHVSRRNRASLALHRRCGFRQVQDWACLLDGTTTNAMVTLLRDGT